MQVVGLDIHRVFAEAVMLVDGTVRRLGRIGMTRNHLTAFAKTRTSDDHVVVEATGYASAVAEVIRPHVGRVVIANPRQVRLIAEARIKTDVIDATVLARLYASSFLPEVWIPDEATIGLGARSQLACWTWRHNGQGVPRACVPIPGVGHDPECGSASTRDGIEAAAEGGCLRARMQIRAHHAFTEALA